MFFLISFFSRQSKLEGTYCPVETSVLSIYSPPFALQNVICQAEYTISWYALSGKRESQQQFAKRKRRNDNAMKTLCRTEGMQTSFIISDLDPAYYNAVRELFFTPHEDGFAKTFPSNAQLLDIFYRHFARTAEEIVLQTARIHPAPWEQALLALLEKVAGQGLQWYLAASAAFASRV